MQGTPCVAFAVKANFFDDADLAHLVERNLAKVEVAGSTPVIRSKGKADTARLAGLCLL